MGLEKKGFLTSWPRPKLWTRVGENFGYDKISVSKFRFPPLFLANLRFCVHYCIDRDTVQKTKNRASPGFFVVMSTTNWDLFLGPLEWARAVTGGTDRWVL